MKGDGRLMAAIFTALLLAIVPAHGRALAGSVQVDPVSVELPHDRSSASLSVRNRDSQPVSMRVRAYRWSQEGGEDVHRDSDDLIVSPPIFTIAPGGRQLIRIGPRMPSAGAAYRIVLEEIPAAAAQGTGIRVALRINLPFYILPEGGGRPALSWSAWRNRDGNVFIEARNSGTRHSQIAALASVDAAGRETVLASRPGVVLPGGSKRWEAGNRPGIAAGSALELRIRNAAGEISRGHVVLEQR
jgi:fimbrial chaperone protein